MHKTIDNTCYLPGRQVSASSLTAMQRASEVGFRSTGSPGFKWSGGMHESPMVAFPGGFNEFRAVIVKNGPNGEDDYKDERYWFKKVACVNEGVDEHDPDDVLQFEIPESESDRQHSTLTCLAEWHRNNDVPDTPDGNGRCAGKVHGLEYDRVVWVIEVADKDGKTHYYTLAEPSEYWGKTTANWTRAGGNGSYVTVNPCRDKDGNGLNNSVTLTVYLPRDGSKEDPNVITGQVIAYTYDSRGHAIARDSNLDGVIDYSCEIWRGNDPAQVTGSNTSLRPGWKPDPTFAGKFPVWYAEGSEDYGTPHATGGYKWHGLTENNHSNHPEHQHFVPGCCYQFTPEHPTSDTFYYLGYAPLMNGVWSNSTSNLEGTDPVVMEHDGPFNTCRDTDNRPPYKVAILLYRFDNSANA